MVGNTSLVFEKLKKLIISTKNAFIDPETVGILFNISPYITCVTISGAVKTLKATAFYSCSNLNKIEFQCPSIDTF